MIILVNLLKNSSSNASTKFPCYFLLLIPMFFFFIFRLKPTKIQQMKIDAFHDVKNFLKDKAFPGKPYPETVEIMMNYISKMEFEEEPDYHHFRSLFR